MTASGPYPTSVSTRFLADQFYEIKGQSSSQTTGRVLLGLTPSFVSSDCFSGHSSGERQAMSQAASATLRCSSRAMK